MVEERAKITETVSVDMQIIHLEYLSLCFALGTFLAPVVIFRPGLILQNIKFAIWIAPAGPISQHFLYLKDYWSPRTLTNTAIGIEDLLFTFVLALLTFTLYPTISRTRLTRRTDSNRKSRIQISLALLISIMLFHTIFFGYFAINSVITSAIFFAIVTAFILRQRPDLVIPSLASGVLVLVAFTTSYQLLEHLFPGILELWCTACNPSGIRALSVNIEEMFWDFTWGAFGGALLPYLYGRKFTRS